MSLTWHIIRKDIRRFWPMSLLLVVLVALETWCSVRLLGHEGEFDYTLFSRVGDYAGLLVFLQILVVVLLTAALIHEDVLTGSSAFWMTRPISNRRLLMAKLGTFVLLAGLLPALAMVPWWIYSGWGLREIPSGVLAMLMNSGAIALLTSPFALVTPNLGRFLLALFLCFVGFLSMTMLRTSWSWLGTSVPALSESRTVIASWLLLVVSVAVIFIQLRPRRSQLARTALGTGYAAIIMALVAWPWAFRDNPGAVESTFTRTIAARAESVRPPPAAWRRHPAYQVNFDLMEVPAGHYVTGGTIKGPRLVWPDTEMPLPVIGPFSTRATIPEAGSLLGLESIQTEATYITPFSANLTIQPAFAERFASEPASYEMIGRFYLHAPRVLGEIPLTIGATLEHGANRTRVVGKKDVAGRPTVWVVDSKPSSHRSFKTFGPGPIGLGTRGLGSNYSNAFNHYLVNRRSNRFFESEPYPGPGAPIRYCAIAHVAIYWREVRFKSGEESANLSSALGADDGLTLASIDSDVIASFERAVVFPASMFSPPGSN